MEISFHLGSGNVEIQLKRVIEALSMLQVKDVDNASLNYVKSLLAGLVAFTANDADDLFDDQKDVDERAMVGCIYRYMYLIMSIKLCDAGLPDIDIEYDRMKGPNAKLCQKAVMSCTDRSCDLEKRKVCEEFVSGQSDSSGKCKCCGRNVRPDMIIHKRNSCLGQGNGLVAEFKREKAQERSVDSAKMQYFTCKNGVLKYLIGAVVTLSKTKQNVVLYRNSEIVCHVSVYEDRVVYEHE